YQKLAQPELLPPHVGQEADVWRLLRRQCRRKLLGGLLVGALELVVERELILALVEPIGQFLLGLAVVAAERSPVADFQLSRLGGRALGGRLCRGSGRRSLGRCRRWLRRLTRLR